MLADLKKEIIPDENKKTKLGIIWLYEPSINFYIKTQKLDWLEEVNRSGVEGDFDFYYVDGLDYFKDEKKVIKEYKITHSYLLKNHAQ